MPLMVVHYPCLEAAAFDGDAVPARCEERSRRRAMRVPDRHGIDSMSPIKHRSVLLLRSEGHDIQQSLADSGDYASLQYIAST